MTGYDIYKRVLNISGYLNNGEFALSEQALAGKMTDIINQICNDLKMPQISFLEDDISAAPIKVDALCYGAAMLLAISEGEIEKNRLFTQIYNAKRTAALSEKTVVEDTLPVAN